MTVHFKRVGVYLHDKLIYSKMVMRYMHENTHALLINKKKNGRLFSLRFSDVALCKFSGACTSMFLWFQHWIFSFQLDWIRTKPTLSLQCLVCLKVKQNRFKNKNV